MPSKTKKKTVAAAALPSIPEERLDQMRTDPVAAVAVNAASMAFRKALIELALEAEFGNHLGYP